MRSNNCLTSKNFDEPLFCMYTYKLTNNIMLIIIPVLFSRTFCTVHFSSFSLHVGEKKRKSKPCKNFRLKNSMTWCHVVKESFFQMIFLKLLDFEVRFQKLLGGGSKYEDTKLLFIQFM